MPYQTIASSTRVDEYDLLMILFLLLNKKSPKQSNDYLGP